MIRKILVANRGEIACRIVRTCQQMGMATVAIYSDADADALHVRMADEAIYVGGNAPGDSYLNITAIIEGAKRTGADAIHPGYGFLAENASFAYAVRGHDLVWIGPPPEAIEAMGDKRVAKLILQNVPFVPGYVGEAQDEATLIQEAEGIGYPIMIKASAGGGGKGMRLVQNAEAMPDAIAAAKREAKQAFGDDMLMLEKAIVHPRHIEVQLFGDQYGNHMTLGERECSIQRRHQKIIEEAPSTALTPALRMALCDTALRIGEQLGYYNAGTVEFLLDDHGEFYFMEMNTRLQVEHPVTEEIYGVDLVRWQIEVARGANLHDLVPLGMALDEFSEARYGHAVEVRVYAENPANDFLPSTGEVLLWQAPEGVRVESGILERDVVTPYYDPMIAKIISHGATRLEAIRKLDYALSKTALHGVRNNISFLRRVLMSDNHLGGAISTTHLEEYPELMAEDAPLTTDALVAVAIAQSDLDGHHWRNNANRPIRHRFHHEGSAYEVGLVVGDGQVMAHVGEDVLAVRLVEHGAHHLVLVIDGHRKSFMMSQAGDMWWIQTANRTYEVSWQTPLPLPKHADETEGSLHAPMPGQVIQIMVEEGQRVVKGDALMILEAMKMEHRIEAPHDGVVGAVRYQVGDSVQADAILLEIGAEDSSETS